MHERTTDAVSSYLLLVPSAIAIVTRTFGLYSAGDEQDHLLDYKKGNRARCASPGD